MHYKPFDDALKARLLERLATFDGATAGVPPDQCALARELGALPLGRFVLNDYYLRPDGSMYSVDVASQGSRPERVSDEAWYFAALRLGTLRFPELAGAIWERPERRPPCAKCAGEGLVAWPERSGQGPRNVCMDCLGRGY